MATTTYHISFPADLAKELEKEMKERYYTPSEYFKMLYRRYRGVKSFEEAIQNYEAEKKAGTLKKLGENESIMDL